MERKVRGPGRNDRPEPTMPTPDACLRTVHRSAASLSVDHSKPKTMTHAPPKQSHNPSPTAGSTGRAIGLDIHPDTFAAAILDGRDPLHARVVASVTRQPLEALGAWAARHTTAEDVLILEASANSFTVADSLLAARERRTRLRRMMALEIEEQPDFLRLYKLAGLNLVTTYALVAIIGDITRFASSKKLVSYLGLNPSVVESGNSHGGGALRSHGRGSLRALLIQASKRLLTTVNPLQKWGLSVALRRGQNKAAVAVARKLTVAIWHVLHGHWNKALEETTTLLTKLTKLATDLGLPTLKELGYTSKRAFQEQKLAVLRTHP